jgi:predicted metalloprotease with PDZ domain
MVITIDEKGMTLNGKPIDRLAVSTLDRLMERLDSLPDMEKGLRDFRIERFSLPDLMTPFWDGMERFRRDWMPSNPPRPRMGIRMGDSEGDKGVRVLHVEPGSPADKAGLAEGDLIVRIGDRKVRHTEDARELLQQGRNSDELKLTVERRGRSMDLKVDLSPPPMSEEI